MHRVVHSIDLCDLTPTNYLTHQCTFIHTRWPQVVPFRTFLDSVCWYDILCALSSFPERRVYLLEAFPNFHRFITLVLCDLGRHYSSRRLCKDTTSCASVQKDLSDASQRHHIEDVVVGGIIGLVTSTSCFLTYWHNPFSKAFPSPRSVYVEAEEAIERPRHEEYRLAIGNEV